MDLAGIATQVPGFTSADAQSGAGAVAGVAWIRGVPGVRTYFDGVPTQITDLAYYFDIAGVEVDKGPQGTLFGLATNGGAIVISTKKPRNDYSGYAEVEFGDYGHRMFEGVLNVPVIDDKLLVRIGYQNNYTDGWEIDRVTNEAYDQVGYWIGRVSVTVNPTDNISNTFMVNYYDDPLINGSIEDWQNYDPDGGLASRYGLPLIRNLFATRSGPYLAYANGAPGGDFASLTQWNIVNTTTWDITDNLTLKNIGGYGEFQLGPSQGLPILVVGLPTFGGPLWGSQQLDPPGPSVQYSEEIQLIGRLFDDKVSFVAGTFNYWDGIRTPHTISYSYFLGSLSGSDNYANSQTHAVYLNATIDLSDFVEGLSFTGGGRQSWDTQHAESMSYTGAGCVNGCPPGPPVQTSVSSRIGTWESPDYTLSLQYKFSRNSMVYVANSNGFSRGGFNASATVSPNYQTFAPENLNNVEIGIKSDFEMYGVKARTNLDSFYGFYNNVQVTQVNTVPNGVGGSQLLVATVNGAEAHIEGIEGDFTIIPDPSIEIEAQGSYGYDKYDKYTYAGIDYTGAHFTFFPKWKANVRAAYHVPSEIFHPAYGALTFTVDYTYEGQKSQVVSEPLLPQEVYPQWHNVDLNLDWNEPFGQTGLFARAYVTNLLQNKWFDGGCSCYTALGLTGQFNAAPRMWGLSLKYTFGPK